MWVRGLKLRKTADARVKQEVAPHVGAWIETNMIKNYVKR